jgi:hypothetical protein
MAGDMWELITGPEDTSSTPLTGATVHVLCFADGFMLLACASAEYFGDSMQEFSAPTTDIGNQYSACEQASNE